LRSALDRRADQADDLSNRRFARKVSCPLIMEVEHAFDKEPRRPRDRS